MNLFVVFTILITLTAVFSFVNEAFIKLPTTIGVMLASLAASILIIGFGYLGFGDVDWAVELVQAADFDHLFMNGMLSFLLFAGASSVNIDDLGEYKWTISYLATLGMNLKSLLAASPDQALALQVFFLACVAVAGAVGALTVSRSILLVQGLPALVGLLLLWASR